LWGGNIGNKNEGGAAVGKEADEALEAEELGVEWRGPEGEESYLLQDVEKEFSNFR
jgi:hypothetical protein